MQIVTIEDIAQLLLAKKIAFNYDTKSVTVNSNQDRMPAIMACYHTETGKLILTDWDYNIITKEQLIEFIEHA